MNAKNELDKVRAALDAYTAAPVLPEEEDDINAVVDETMVDEVTEETVIEETPWAEPFMGKSAPPKFPYEERTLMPIEDARKVKSTADALIKRGDEVKKLLEAYADLRRKVESDIAKNKEADNFAKLQEEVKEISGRLGDVILEDMADQKDKLYYHGDTLYAVYEVNEKPPGAKVDAQKILRETLEKYVAKDIAGKILKEAGDLVKEETAKLVVLKNRLAIFPAPQNIKKKVKKQESLQTQAISLKEIGTGIVDVLKKAWTSLSEGVKSLASALTAGDSLIDDINAMLGAETNLNASKEISIIASALK